jgi:ribosome-associated translation inhibitor RaiA
MAGLVLRPQLTPDHIERAFEAQVLPVDKYGMPYLIHPQSIAPDAGWNYDHTWFFGNLPAFADDAGSALRHTRLQHLSREQHDRKHNVFFRQGLEWIPETEGHKFALSVMAIGGYASRMAVDVSGNKPALVRMSNDIYNFVRGKNQLQMVARRDPETLYLSTDEAKRKISAFFASYVQKQQIGEFVNENVINRFLHAPDEVVRMKIGDFIMQQAIDKAAEPLERDYRKALGRGLLRPSIQRAAEAVIAIFPQPSWSQHHDTLEAELLAA